MSKDQLRETWSNEFRKELPKALTRDLLLRTLVWRLQERVFGGHDRDSLKLLDAHAQGRGNDPMYRRLKSGTVLIREYRGARHTVTIATDGFIWREKTYPNLSVIARAITGSNWNGPRFFGLREKPKGKRRTRQYERVKDISLRHLYPQIDGTQPRPRVQLVRCPAGSLRSLHQESNA